ncbi:hypothetical protein EVAR_32598_1 [Eumeta japonica]|uniref:Uncharacterized protein n=1 Tax=Eumeta variegata TaxID=151549 RepID=A0A4C1WGZ7_EUMVA|nr:hypothetical protein EVAR_32598_1 [Eumeta japonica]
MYTPSILYERAAWNNRLSADASPDRLSAAFKLQCSAEPAPGPAGVRWRRGMAESSSGAQMAHRYSLP